MTELEKQLAVDLATHTITKEEFLQRFPASLTDNTYLMEGLKSSRVERNADDVECLMLLFFCLGFDKDKTFVPVLCDLLAEDWHRNHEDIAMVMQSLRASESVEVLYHAATRDLAYLDFDEAFALAVKCCWALGDIGTPEAIEKLKLIAQSPNKVKREAALYQLDRIGA
jgi:hypothetical protein